MYVAQVAEKPAYRHALVYGVLAALVALSLTSGYIWDLTARAAAEILSIAGISNSYVGPLYLLYVRLLDGTVAGFQILIECSGLITLAIFSVISTFTIGLLRGSLKLKLLWFISSITVGLLWNLSRLVFVVAVAYNFGFPSFSLVHYVLAPSIDFIWIVSMWGLGMSLLRRREAVP